MWKFTGGLHVTAATNASRTPLMGLGSGAWSDGLIDLVRATRDLAGSSRRLGAGDLAVRVDPSGPPELRDAANAITRVV